MDAGGHNLTSECDLAYEFGGGNAGAMTRDLNRRE